MQNWIHEDLLLLSFLPSFSSEEGSRVVMRAREHGQNILLLDEPFAKFFLGHELFLVVLADEVELARDLVETEARQVPRPNAALDHFLGDPVSHAHPHIEVPLGCALGPSTKTAGESLP
jgi:hypothetical protein